MNSVLITARVWDVIFAHSVLCGETVRTMPKGAKSKSPSKKKKKKPKSISENGSPGSPGDEESEEDQDAAEVAAGAALLMEALALKKPLNQRVRLDLTKLKIAHPFIVFTPAVGVSEELKAKAAKWETWTSKADEPTFSFTYDAEERILVTKGKATVTPTEEPVGSTVYGALCQDGIVVAPQTISAGDSVIFMEGLACRWDILEPLEYKWVYTEAIITCGWSHVWCESEKELSTTRGRELLSQRVMAAR